MWSSQVSFAQCRGRSMGWRELMEWVLNDSAEFQERGEEHRSHDWNCLLSLQMHLLHLHAGHIHIVVCYGQVNITSIFTSMTQASLHIKEWLAITSEREPSLFSKAEMFLNKAARHQMQHKWNTWTGEQALNFLFWFLVFLKRRHQPNAPIFWIILCCWSATYKLLPAVENLLRLNSWAYKQNLR